MRTALLVIDVQRIYTDPTGSLACTDAAATVTAINKLISRFEANKDLIVYVRHVHSSDGSDLGRMFDFAGEAEDFNFVDGTEEVEYDPRLRIVLNATHIVKKRYSAFVGTMLQERLVDTEIDTVVICGFMTNFCCDSTARQAHDLDYWVDFIIDATGTPGTESLDQDAIRHVVSDLLGEGIARVQTVNEYLGA